MTKKEERDRKERTVKSWLKHAKENLESAKVMLDAGRYTWCAFICQQALEKCLKAGYVKKKNKVPPYIHKLERLCEILELKPPKKILEAIIHIDKYYIAARYPSYKEGVNITDDKTAKKVFKDTKDAYKWLGDTLRLKD